MGVHLTGVHFMGRVPHHKRASHRHPTGVHHVDVYLVINVHFTSMHLMGTLLRRHTRLADLVKLVSPKRPIATIGTAFYEPTSEP